LDCFFCGFAEGSFYVAEPFHCCFSELLFQFVVDLDLNGMPYYMFTYG
jgi:hypothetical protein